MEERLARVCHEHKKVGKFCLHGNPIFSVTTFVTKQTMLHYIKHTLTPPFTHGQMCAHTHFHSIEQQSLHDSFSFDFDTP